MADNLILHQENKMADDSLLALCIGNRSAVLYELGMIEVLNTLRLIDESIIICASLCRSA